MNLPFTLQQLKILKAISIVGNFTEASKNLYISQPSLSKQLRVLENRFHVSLIKREKNKIYLTKSGKIFLQYSERILELCEESCKALIEIEIGNRGTLIVGTNQIIINHLLLNIVDLFKKKYPKINIFINTHSSKLLIQNINKGYIDLAIIADKLPKFLNSSLNIEKFTEDGISLIVSKIHLFKAKKKKKITINKLYNFNLIKLNSNFIMQKLINYVLCQNDLRINNFTTTIQLNSIESVTTAINLGIGISFIDLSKLEIQIKLKKTQILTIKDKPLKQTLWILTNPRLFFPKPLKFFYHELNLLKQFVHYKTIQF